MPDVLLDRLLAERDDRTGLIRSLTGAAAEAERDLSDQDKDTITRAQTRITEIDGQLDLLSNQLDMSEEVRNRLARLNPQAVQPTNTTYATAGELLYDMLHAHHSRDASQRYNRYITRAAEHMGTTAAATTPTAGGFAGLLTVPTVGTVLDLKPSGRPLVSSLGTAPMPNGWSFMRPRVVDTHLDDGVGVQALQKAELVSKHFDILADSIAPVTVGGYLNVSQQLLTWVAQALDLVIGQMGKRLSRYEEAAAVTALTATTATVPLTDATDPAAVLAAFFAASALVYTNTGELATNVAMGPLGWQALGSLVDSAGRPMFPWLGAANAMGSMSADSFGLTGPAGLTPVVTYGITTNDFYVYNAAGLEAYEYRFPVLEAVEPSVLGRQIAVAASLAFYSPTTTEAVTGGSPVAAKHEAVVKINVT